MRPEARETSAADRPRRRPGGRSAVVRSAVHAATLALLDEVGFERLQLTEVAHRAGVNKTTVYRRWSSKVELVADLLTDLAAHEAPTPDTGSLEDDLLILLRETHGLLHRRAVTSIIRAGMALGEEEGEARDARDRFWETRFASSTTIVERAIRRGDLPDSTDPHRFLEAVFGPMYLRVLIFGHRLDEQELIALARRSTDRSAPGVAQSDQGPSARR